MIRAFDHARALMELCRLSGKWGMYVYINEPDVRNLEADKAAPYLEFDNPTHLQIMADGSGFFLFDTKEEMEARFNATVGDDGPTDLNPYDGPARVYALTCDPTGQCHNENT